MKLPERFCLSIVPLWAKTSRRAEPIQTGSGVLVADGREHVLLTAGHVLKDLFDAKAKLEVPGRNGVLFEPYGLRVWVNSSPEMDFGAIILGPSAAFHLRHSFVFLSPADLDQDFPLITDGPAILFGFPSCKSEVELFNVYSRGVKIASGLADVSRHREAFSSESHIFVDFRRRKGFVGDFDGRRVKLMHPEGMSGGGIFSLSPDRRIVLSGIIADYHRKEAILGGPRICLIRRALTHDYADRWGSIGAIFWLSVRFAGGIGLSS